MWTAVADFVIWVLGLVFRPKPQPSPEAQELKDVEVAKNSDNGFNAGIGSAGSAERVREPDPFERREPNP